MVILFWALSTRISRVNSPELSRETSRKPPADPRLRSRTRNRTACRIGGCGGMRSTMVSAASGAVDARQSGGLSPGSAEFRMAFAEAPPRPSGYPAAHG